MTMIAATAFPEGVIVLSDSRVSYLKSNKDPEDRLKKIFQLNKQLLLAFTTSNVALTWKIIEKMTIKAKTLQHLSTSEFVFQIGKYAQEVYIKEKNVNDNIEFIYAGLDFKAGTKINSNKLKRILNKYHSMGGYENKLSKTKVSNKKHTIVPPPSVLLVRQVFPSGELIFNRGWDMGTAGSGKGFIKELEKYYAKIFCFGTLHEKAIILKNLCDDYIKSSGISSIGGFVQVFMISEDNGVESLSYEEKVNGIVKKRRYISLEGKWVEEDLENGKTIEVVQNL